MSNIGQAPDTFMALVGSVQPKIAIVRDSDGAELWINPFEGRVGLPGYHIELRFGAPPEGAYTSPAAFFGSGAVSTLTGPGWFGVPVWVWIAGGIAVTWFMVKR